MLRYIILRQSHTAPAAFEGVKDSLCQAHLWDEGGDGEIKEWTALPQGAIGGEDFARAAAFLTVAVKESGALTVLVDEVDPLRLDPIMPYGWNTLLAMLILAFPEVRWHFLVVANRPGEQPAGEKDREPLRRWKEFEDLHGISAVFQDRGTPLFDGYGLRQHVLDCMRSHDPAEQRKADDYRHVVDSVPTRRKVATVLDEEQGYGWLEACMAYSRGFRAHAIASWKEAEGLLGPQGLIEAGGQAGRSSGELSSDYALSLEDWFLNYPDQTRQHMSDLARRSDALPALKGSPSLIRRFITVGHGQQKDRHQDRAAQLRDLRAQERMALGGRVSKSEQVAYKPASGLYTLWKELGLYRAFRNEDQPALYRGFARGFVWPPMSPDATPWRGLGGDGGAGEGGGHSSPGRLLQIAEHLLRRVSAFVDEVNTVTEAVRGAVLAMQALELLGCKTPTVSVEALRLKHTFEVVAECQFVGVEYHLSMDGRLEDIRNNLMAMQRWLHSSRRKEFILNAEAMILRSLIVTLDNYGEYEESQTCQCRLRTLHRLIGLAQDWRERKLLRLMLSPFHWYADFVLRSTAHFGAMLFLVISVFTVAFRSLSQPSWTEALHATLGAMLTLYEATPRYLSVLAAATAVVHFGLLVTLLYDRIARR